MFNTILKFIEKHLGQIYANKFQLWLGATKRNPFTRFLVNLINGFIVRWDQNNNTAIRSFLVLAPLLVFFMFSGMLSFIICAVILVSYISFLLSAKR